MEEATSRLDSESDALRQSKPRATSCVATQMCVIAHRLRAIRVTDQTLRCENGHTLERHGHEGPFAMRRQDCEMYNGQIGFGQDLFVLPLMPV